MSDLARSVARAMRPVLKGAIVEERETLDVVAEADDVTATTISAISLRWLTLALALCEAIVPEHSH